MKQSRLSDWFKSRIGFIVILVALLWAKTQMANIMDFKLYQGASPVQWITLLVNPIPIALLLLSFALYFKSPKLFYPISLIIYIANIALVQLNVIYYREFSDFMSVLVMLGYDKVNQGLGASGFALSNVHDIFFWLDLIVLLILVVFRKIRLKAPAVAKFKAFSITSFAILGSMLVLMLSEMDRPQLITRQFDSKMMVRYLGLDSYTFSDAIRAQKVSEMKSSAKKSDIEKVQKYIRDHNVPANAKYAGIAKGRNVFVIHLESTQQFSLDLKVNGQEVTPFLNSIYHSKSTIGFDNFFNQVGQGKTSDAENMLETSTFGLPQGSLFATQGSDHTFQAMPSILKQTQGYSSAVFHGNTASFWNRNNVYKNMGYQYFFDASYYDTSGDKATGYGLKDKLLFYDSIPYLERLQQPFYAKYITVTNHFPYSLDSEDKDPNFQTTDSGSKVVDGYFETNHYMDQSIHEFFDYLKSSGLYDNSIIVMYGDHYGISNSENKALAPILGKDPDKWNANDNAQLQRVPFMIHIPGYKGGFINHTYGGEIDVMPTLLHLLGVTDTKKYVELGQDLLSDKRQQVVAMRDGDVITPQYSYINSVMYDNKTDQPIENPTEAQLAQAKKATDAAHEQLRVSDAINQKDLLRFYTPKGFKPVDAKEYNYSNGLEKLKNLEKQRKSSSRDLFTIHGNKSTQPLYKTDAPEKDQPRLNTSRIQQINPDQGDATDGGNDKPNP
ncbi:alkaline phosphatase [Weissella viridescens]|uniref:Phosphatidylglycerol--membrane-oligosaccharide glycerophosphotransferase n=1 Tax=Weissella viridescens TaxID=1629 RepID=A0A0R2GZT1_WEIVI|nr:LTA synthase family protein [Weissella viridescens]KRN46259.1 phosphatidylglycerol--membrane-oligosaccharide glycerophosphotransferase [Weissella viridescens]GEA95120.1 alkaline phosphatase [Weissella viridescens]